MGPVSRQEANWPAVSVVMATYQRPTELARALASVQLQKPAPAEIIVIDDGERARGAAAARNEGWRRAKGAVMAFLDDDDEWLPGYLSTAVGKLVREELDVVCTDLLIHRPRGEDQRGKRAPERLEPEAFLERNPGLGGSNLVVRRDVLAAVGGFDESLPTLNDMDLGLRLAMHGVAYGAVSEPLVRYHHHDGPRLSIRGSLPRRLGVERFFALHGRRMSSRQRHLFRERMHHEGVLPAGAAGEAHE